MKNKTVGSVILERRRFLELSQNDVARMTQNALSPQHLSDIEQGRRGISVRISRALARVLDVSPDYLEMLAGRVPDDIAIGKISEEVIVKSCSALREAARAR